VGCSCGYQYQDNNRGRRMKDDLERFVEEYKNRKTYHEWKSRNKFFHGWCDKYISEWNKDHINTWMVQWIGPVCIHTCIKRERGRGFSLSISSQHKIGLSIHIGWGRWELSFSIGWQKRLD